MQRPYARRSVCDKTSDELMYDLRRKHMLNEDDEKPCVNNSLGRVMNYIYGTTVEGRTYQENIEHVKEHLMKKYNLNYNWCGGRVFKQDAAKNTAIVDGKECYVMSSCSYAGVPSQPEIMEYAVQRVRESGPNFGSYAVLGFNEDVDLLNKTVARYYKREAAMCAVSGFLACQNIVDFLVTSAKGKSVVIADAFVHRSLRQGMKSADLVLYFKHNNAADFLRLVEKYTKGFETKICIIESVYSADGDVGDLPNFRKACDETGCVLVCDDAHGVGVIGPNAGGVEDHFNMPGACDYICGTFSKSCSAQGGYVVSNNKTVIGTLIISSGVGFATGMNSFSAAYCTKALEFIMEKGREQVKEALRLRNYMVEGLKKRFGDTLGKMVRDTPSRLVTIMFHHPTLAMHLQHELIKGGYLVGAFLFPAVEMHYSLLRLTVIPYVYTDEKIDGFIDALAEALERCKCLEDDLQTELLYPSLSLSRMAEESGCAKFSNIITQVKTPRTKSHCCIKI